MKQVTNIHKATHTGFIRGHINMCKNINTKTTNITELEYKCKI